MLLCTVRNCRQALEQIDRRMVCPKGHSFDIARSGYVNLLQPQDKRSSDPGDSPTAVTARRRLHDQGVTEPLLNAICSMLEPTNPGAVLDAGCGDGYYLGGIKTAFGADCWGVDISVAAIESAARRYPSCGWVVANADRFLPWPDGSFSTVVSITGRMNPAEFHRILTAGGHALVAVPSPEDLIELRGVGRERIERTVEDFSANFRLVRQERATTVVELDAASVEDVLHAIYRPLRKDPAGATRVTFSLDLLLFESENH